MIQTPENCEVYINETYKLFHEKRYTDLIEHYKSIIDFKHQYNEQEYGNDVEKYYSNLSYIYYIIRDFENALIQAQNCIKIANDWYKGYYRAAKACEGLLNKKDALEYYEKMIAIYKESLIKANKKMAKEDKNSITQKEMNEYHNVDINILKEWLVKNGAVIDKTVIEYYDVDYRGMYVDKPIRPNENIMQIPISCVISLEESKTRGYNKRLIELGAQYNSTHTYLALELLDIKHNPSHKMQYYMNCLPRFFNNVPINFDETKLKNLEGSFALVKIAQKKQFLENDYKHIKSLLPEYPYSYEDFVWARTAIITRVYAIDRDFEGADNVKTNIKDTVMVPFADMANHTIPPNTHWFFDKPSDMFVVKAAKYLDSGDNLFESYGPKCNYRYFVNYGFTVEKNPFEEVALVMNPMLLNSISEKLYLRDANILNYINATHEIFQIGYNTKSDQMQNLINYSRNKCAELLKPHGKDPTLENVYTLILGFMDRMMSGFDTTIEEDENMLKIYINHDIKNCIIQRLGEKKVLKYYTDYFTDLITAESIKNPNEKKKFIKKLEKKYTQN